MTFAVLLFCVLPLAAVSLLAMREINVQTISMAQSNLRDLTKTYALSLLDLLEHAEMELHLRQMGKSSYKDGTLIDDFSVVTPASPLSTTMIDVGSHSVFMQVPEASDVLIGTVDFEKLFTSLGHVQYGVQRCIEIDGHIVLCEGSTLGDEILSSKWQLPLDSVYDSRFELSVVSSQSITTALQHVSLVSKILPLAMLVVASLIAWIMIRLIRRRMAPLSDLQVATRAVHQGDYTARVYIQTGDEFEVLG